MSEPWSVCVRSESPAETRALAAALASVCERGDLLVLAGELGAGKTVFAQGFARGLGIEGPVTSPTFTLVRQYGYAGPGGIRQLVHADLYRLDHTAEVADLALAELVEDGGVGLVEWGDRAEPVLGESVLVVTLAVSGEHDEGRVVTLSGRGTRWVARRDEVAAALERRPAVAGGAEPR